LVVFPAVLSRLSASTAIGPDRAARVLAAGWLALVQPRPDDQVVSGAHYGNAEVALGCPSIVPYRGRRRGSPDAREACADDDHLVLVDHVVPCQVARFEI
jgi:hypothetical protein